MHVRFYTRCKFYSPMKRKSLRTICGTLHALHRARIVFCASVVKAHSASSLMRIFNTGINSTNKFLFGCIFLYIGRFKCLKFKPLPPFLTLITCIHDFLAYRAKKVYVQCMYICMVYTCTVYTKCIIFIQPCTYNCCFLSGVHFCTLTDLHV